MTGFSIFVKVRGALLRSNGMQALEFVNLVLPYESQVVAMI